MFLFRNHWHDNYTVPQENVNAHRIMRRAIAHNLRKVLTGAKHSLITNADLRIRS
jgi:hypothetical protein